MLMMFFVSNDCVFVKDQAIPSSSVGHCVGMKKFNNLQMYIACMRDELLATSQPGKHMMASENKCVRVDGKLK